MSEIIRRGHREILIFSSERFSFDRNAPKTPRVSGFHQIMQQNGINDFEERTFYLVPIDKSIHSEDRERVLKKCIVIPTPNFEDPKEDEVLQYKETCAKFSVLKSEEQ